MSLKTWIANHVLPTPEWKLNNEACARYVVRVFETDFDRRAAELRAEFPKMADEFVKMHVKLNAEHEFWARLRAGRTA